jgi:hypothetical protein
LEQPAETLRSQPPARTNRPDDTAWEDGTFKLSVEFTEEYPNKAPTVKFLTKMFHPNSTRLLPTTPIPLLSTRPCPRLGGYSLSLTVLLVSG